MARDPSDQRLSAIRGFPSETSYKLSAASGLGFVGLLVLSFIFLGTDYPTYDDPAQDYVSYYGDQQNIQIGILLSAFAAFSFAWFLGFLRWVYEGSERATRGFVRATPIAFAGGVVGLSAAVAGGMAQTAAVETVGQVSPDVTRALDLMSDYSLVWAALLLTVFLLSSFFLIRVTGVLPGWLGIVAAASVPLGFIQSVLLLAPEQDDGALGIVGLIWYVLFLVFVLGASITLLRSKDTRLLPS